MNKKYKRFYVAAVAFAVFAAIALSVINNMQQGDIPKFDSVVGGEIISMRSDFFTPIVKAITHFGDAKTIIFLCAFMLLWKKTRFEFGLPISCTALITVSIQSLLKSAVARQRPPVESFLIEQGGYSFPSGHSCSSFVFYGFLFYMFFHMPVENVVEKAVTYFVLAVPFAVGFSRIYLGVHYPTDVLAGQCLGLGILMIEISTFRKIKYEITLRERGSNDDK